MARAVKLKVYCMLAGFYDAVVAAPSQKGALRAWGTTTDLFAAGRASEVEDEALKAEALARPGEVLERMHGNEAAMLGPEPVETAPTRVARRREAEPRSAPPPPPDRSVFDAAKRELSEAERELAASLEALATERRELDRRERDIRATGEARISELRVAKERAEDAYRTGVERAARTRAA